MKIIGVIPARWASTRFEGKVLAPIAGKSMIQHVYERARESSLLQDVIVACDDDRVHVAAVQFGARTVMTSTECASGTDRIAEAIAGIEGDIIVNIQGDEPLIEPRIIDALAQALIDDASCAMATVIRELTDERQLKDPNVVKAVVDGERNALYFSRATIPFDRDGCPDAVYYKHLGIYAYRRDFIMSYKDLPKSNLEKVEQLEQLRALEFGYKIKTVLTDVETVGVDTKEDLKRVEALMAARSQEQEESS